MMALPYGEEIMIVRRTMWTQSTSVTDRRTDGRTELRSQRPCNAERRTVITSQSQTRKQADAKVSSKCGKPVAKL